MIRGMKVNQKSFKMSWKERRKRKQNNNDRRIRDETAVKFHPHPHPRRVVNEFCRVEILWEAEREITPTFAVRVLLALYIIAPVFCVRSTFTSQSPVYNVVSENV